MLLPRAASIISEQRVNAEWALQQVFDHLGAIFDGVEDPYLRERKGDLADVVGRLRMNLTPGGAGFRDVLGECEAPCVLVADELPPSIAAQLDWNKFEAFITDAGSRTYHTAILARSLHVPAVVGLHDATARIAPGTLILVDGDEGTVSIDPPPDVVRNRSVCGSAGSADGAGRPTTARSDRSAAEDRRRRRHSRRGERRSARRRDVRHGAGRRRHRAVPIGAAARGPSRGRADRGHAVRDVPAAARGRAARAGHGADVRHRRRSARQRRASPRHAVGERIRGAAQPARAAIDSPHAEAPRAAAHAAARAGARRRARRSSRDVSVRVGHRGAARGAQRAGRGAPGNRGARACRRARSRSA